MTSTIFTALRVTLRAHPGPLHMTACGSYNSVLHKYKSNARYCLSFLLKFAFSFPCVSKYQLSYFPSML